MTAEWPLRRRLTVWYSFALAVGLVAFAFAIWFSMRQSLVGNLDRTLTDRAASVETFINAELQDPAVKLSEELGEYCHAFPPDSYLELRDDTGRVLFASSAKFPFADNRVNVRSLLWQRRQYRISASSISIAGKQATVLVAGSMEAIRDILDRLRFLLLAFVPAVILVSVAGGAWLSRRALRPLDRLAAAAQSISINNLSERLTVPQTGDELQRLSETWNTMLLRLEAAVTRLSRFTADASHELRTPLAIIRASAEIASRKSRSAESYRGALNQIVVDCERMTDLVENLLLLARCDGEASEMPMSVVDLAQVTQDVCHHVRPWTNTKRQQLLVDIKTGPLLIKGSEQALRRLMLVLLTNAVQYSDEGKCIHVELSSHSDKALILEVRDHGSGIPQPELQLIFERFYRASDARRSSPNGSGLGLSLAAGIAHRHGAKIDVVSEVGRGSTFRVTFPIAPSFEQNLKDLRTTSQTLSL